MVRNLWKILALLISFPTIALAQPSGGGDTVVLRDGAVTARRATVTTGLALKTDASATTQPVSVASMPLPTGAATEATLATMNAKIPASPATDRATAIGPFSVRLSDGAAFYKATTPADTQPVSLASQPLPTGAATEATLALIKAKTDNLDVLLSTRTKPADTQPVSVASLPLPAGASTEATLALIKAKTDNLDVLLSTRTKPADQQHVIVDSGGGGGTQYTEDVASAGAELVTLSGAIRSDTPASSVSNDGDFTNLKTDSVGRLWVNGSGVTQPISGTVTANDGQTITDNGAFTDGTSKLFVTGHIFDEVAGTALTENDAAAPRVNANRAVVSTIEDGATRARYATVTASNALKTDASATTQPVSAASLPLPAGASTAANQATANASLASIDGKDFATQTTLALIKAKTDNLDVLLSTRTKPADQQHVIVDSGGGGGTQYTEDVLSAGAELVTLAGAIRADTPGSTTSTDGDFTNLKSDSIGRLWVNNSGVVQAVSGTFWQATQPVSGTFWQATQPISVASLPLPAGAATAAKQPALGTAGTASADVITIQGIASMTAVKTDSSATTQPVSGTFWQATQPVSGTVTTTPPSNASTNVAQINGVTPLMGNGASGTGAMRVTIANDSTGQVALAAGSASIGTVQIGNTPNTTPILVTQIPATSGGLTTFHLVSAGTTNATVVKASAGQLCGWYIYNSNAAARKVAFHNASSTPTAGVSLQSSLVIPPTSAANAFSTNCAAFSTGISITTVTGLADNDSAAVAANDLIINLYYK